MTKEERELFELKFKGLKAEIKANHDIQMIKLNNIECQAIKTNGRVNELEKETRVTRLFERKPVLFVFVLVGMIVLYALVDLKTILSIIK